MPIGKWKKPNNWKRLPTEWLQLLIYGILEDANYKANKKTSDC